MTRVPNELVEAIVQEVGDVPSLKACSLVGSAFRYLSQRILLHSLTLKEYPPNYTAARLFLEKSPHVATYIDIVCIRLPAWYTPIAQVESLMQVLNRLEKVRSCTVIGTLSRRSSIIPIAHPQTWNKVTTQVSDAVFGFLARHSLRELRVLNIEGLSVPAFFGFLRAAPKITLSF
ncbi:hypothetical protein B0H13DRAFT_1891669 [Mycena leptocephala]|nr:hypothetical protein B0H13DRAFT_1891669 [Mycena leptocephala]